MPKRTQIICLHEGNRGSVDLVFVNRVLKDLNPNWIRSTSSGLVRFIPLGGRANVIHRMPGELKACLSQGSDTTLLVLADLDDDMRDGDALKETFWKEAEQQEITPEQFESVVFLFPKDRIENWIEFLNKGSTDEQVEGPRVSTAEAKEAARKLAKMCKENSSVVRPTSLEWSCNNWNRVIIRMSN